MSCEFIDGPAAGVSLDLHRAPHFLRVTTIQDPSPEAAARARSRRQGMRAVDALDQPDDVPEPFEDVHVYVSEAGSFGQVFVCGRGSGGGFGRYESARYRHLPVDESVRARIRDRREWIAWVREHGDDAAIAAGLDPWAPTGTERKG